MSEWIRNNDSGISRFSFTVKRDNDPDLYAFVRSLPYGTISLHLKAALRLYLNQIGDMELAASSAPVALMPASDTAARAPQIRLQAQHTPAPATTLIIRAQEPDLETEITSETVVLIQSLLEQFHVSLPSSLSDLSP